MSLVNTAELTYFINYNISRFFSKEKNISLSSKERVRVRSNKRNDPTLVLP